MTIRRDKPNAPPPEYDQRWMFWFWQYANSKIGTGDLSGTFGPFAGIQRFNLVGAALGTTTTGTLTSVLSTTTVAPGTYGNSTAVGQFVVTGDGRLIAATSVDITVSGSGGTGGGFNPWITVGAVTGTATTGTLTAAFNPNPAFTGTGTAAGWLVTGTATGAMYSVGTATGGFSRWGTATVDLLQGVDANLAGTATSVGIIFTGTGTGAMVSVGTATGGFSRWGTASMSLLQAVDGVFTGTLTSAGGRFSGTTTAPMVQVGTDSAGLVSAGTSSAALIQGTNLVLSGTGTAVGMLMSGTTTGAMSQWGTATGGFSRWGTSSTALVQAQDVVFSGTGTAAGWLVSGTMTAAMIQVGTGTGGFSRWGTSSASLIQFVDGVFTGTLTGAGERLTGTSTAAMTQVGTASGVLFNANKVQAYQGSSTVFENVLVGGDSIVGSTRTTQAIFTYAAATAPINAILGTGNGARMKVWGTWVSRPTAAWIVGSGTITFNPPAPGLVSARWSSDIEVYSMSNTTQTYRAFLWQGGGTTANYDLQVGTLALATGSAIVIRFIGTQATNATTNVLHGGIFNFRNGP